MARTAIVSFLAAFAAGTIDMRPHMTTNDADFKAAFLTEQLTENIILVPEHNFLFCYIEKVGATSFNRFFFKYRNVTIPKPWCCNMWWLNTPRRLGYDLHDVERILHNKSWHKAVFFRDPVVRYVSGFLSKCTGGHDLDRWHCEAEFGSTHPTFDAALQRTIAQPTTHHDVHWQPQANFCGGLSQSLQYYDTVIRFEQSSLRTDVVSMLRSAGFPDTSHFRTLVDENFPLTSKDSVSAHSTDSSSRTKEMFTDVTNRAALVAAYEADYKVFPGLRFEVDAETLSPPQALTVSGERYAWVTMASKEAHMRDAMAMMRSLHEKQTVGEKILMLFGNEARKLHADWATVFSELKALVCFVELPIVPDDVIDSTYEAIVTRSGKWWDWVKLYGYLLTQFTRVIFLDSDLLFLENVDELFHLPDGTHADGPMSPFNSGLVVVAPSERTFRELVSLVLEGNFTFERGWRQAQRKDDVPLIGAETTQGLLHYYYDRMQRSATHSDPPKLLDRNVYNYQAIEPAPPGIKVVHFTACGKPYDPASEKKCPTFKAKWLEYANVNAATLRGPKPPSTVDVSRIQLGVPFTHAIIEEERTKLLTIVSCDAPHRVQSLHLVTERHDDPFRYRAMSRPAGASVTFAITYARIAPNKHGAHIAKVLVMMNDDKTNLDFAVANIPLADLHFWHFTCALDHGGKHTTGEVIGHVEASQGLKPHVVVNCEFDSDYMVAGTNTTACNEQPSGIKLRVTARYHTSKAYGNSEPYVGVLPLFWDAPAVEQDVGLCTAPLFGAPEQHAKLRARIAMWWTFHEALGVERAYLYDRARVMPASPPLHPTHCHEHGTRGLKVVDAWQPDDVAVGVNMNYRSRVYHDQPTMYAHCWLKHGARVRWLVNIDFDEFLMANRVSDANLSDGVLPIPRFFNGLLARVPAVARVNIPRVTHMKCPQDDVLHEQSLRAHHQLRSVLQTLFCNRTVVELAITGKFCRLEHGGVYQKSAFQPSLISAVDTHYVDYPNGVYTEEGQFITHEDNKGFDPGRYEGLFAIHIGELRSEKDWVKDKNTHKIIVDDSIGCALRCRSFGCQCSES